MENKKINVVIADDHKLFRKGIIAILSDFDFINPVGEAENGQELLELLEKLEGKTDIILLDVQMPVMDGIEANKKLRDLYPDIKVIILTQDDDKQLLLHLINEGVNGYLMKNADPEELEHALKMVVKNDFYFSNAISNLILKKISAKNKTRKGTLENFSKKEIMILELICKEFTAYEIAEKLNLSVRTIEGDRGKLLEKTGTRNMAGLVIYAIKNKLVTL